MQTSVPVIDGHHHLWRYTPEEFGWIDDTMKALQRDFLPEDLEREMESTAVDGTVAVQARQSLEETHWLCSLAQKTPQIRGVVGWAPIASPEFPKALDEITSLPTLVGLRHIVQAELAGYLDSAAFNQGIRHLTATGLAYDILIFERQMEEAIRFVDRHPNQRFVLDHLAKPRIGAGELEPWRTCLRELSRRPNVTCKISGLVTEADWHTWTIETLRPYLDFCVESFGPSRLIAGSDWPVCLVACSYATWWKLLRQYFSTFTAEEKDAILGGNAIEFYRL
jgi:L-fuconolactonase